jgi:hypothetical protein
MLRKFKTPRIFLSNQEKAVIESDEEGTDIPPWAKARVVTTRQRIALVGAAKNRLANNIIAIFCKHSAKYNMSEWASMTLAVPVDKTLPLPGWFVSCYFSTLNRSISTYSQVFTERITPFDEYVVKKRNYLKFQLWKKCRNLEDAYREHPGMTEEEQEKVEQALQILQELCDKKAWNRNTLVIKQKVEL